MALFEAAKFNVEEIPNKEGKIYHVATPHNEAVAILPVLGEGKNWYDNSVVLIRHYRPAIGEEMLEIPAGTMDVEGESVLSCATRELEEETGYIGKIEFLHSFRPSPGFTSEIIHVCVATDIVRENDNLGLPGEGISELVVVLWGEFFQMIKEGKIQDGKTIVAASFYGLSLSP